ncbi:MAG: TMEM165/GDT1 family protein [Acidimicrobiales bacterium]
MAFFFGHELGDKNNAGHGHPRNEQRPVGTWIGSTVGMVAADALAIVAGQQLGARLPEKTVRIGAAITFVGFGLLLIFEGLRQLDLR